MASRLDAPTITRRRSVLACARCRARRVKCDRAQPTCSNCKKAGALCQPAQQRYSPSVTSRAGTDKSEDYTRLSRLEEKVARLSREVDSTSPSRAQSRTSSLEKEDFRAEALRGNIISGPKPIYFSPISWGTFAEELNHAQNTHEEVPVQRGGFSYGQNPRMSLPDESLHEILLDVFRKRVDPLVRVLHLPTFLDQYRAFKQTMYQRDEISAQSLPSTYYPVNVLAPQQGECVNIPPTASPHQRSTSKPEALKLPSEAFVGLLYSVYYAAVVTLIEDPNQVEIGHGVDIFNLAATLKREVQERVMRIGTDTPRSSLQLLQGMVLVMALEPEPFDVQAQSLQLSVAISRARELGLHRDGSKFALGPIEIEVRRRIWAHLCILDTRYAEQLGCEPKIMSDSYDTCLPLSIDDMDLTDIEAQESERGSEMYKSHEEIESGQRRQSPFSLMTLTLISAEASRLLSHILTVRYQSQDAIANAPAAHVPHNGPRAHMGRLRCIDQFEQKYQTVYGLGRMDSSHPLQLLTSECAGLSVARASFLSRTMSWKEEYASMSAHRRDMETSDIATRTLDLIRRYTNTPFGWYTKHFRDPYSTTFLALNLARGVHVKEEKKRLACSVLTQLFPLDSTGRFLEHGLHRSRFGKLLLEATWSRQAHTTTQNFNPHAVMADNSHTSSVFPSSMSADMSILGLPACTAGSEHLQAAPSMYGNINAMMDDSLWASAVPGTGSSHSSWV
ncbi:uncharacterized protein EI97DRAFT_19444 [Westerdykella ornata]|uniref:Zn(2)-C6 fungal-type domain-containing protein n=1 Tax=Westerdykella ornata TaxID=318751 RepID=A0A6A6JWS8_WESOR|nr:uncharacterized protein EI97DRAFT_19444 [Westerdykella ornata]KAF2281062.1 hypothetical protein EI97DRAFT_19444 [Westerdykella ornata]